jgi:NAD(P)-dependent dehydrogenase (short-subunit alcohol dehydrogenase family)
MSIQDKHIALITGAAKGIGYGIAYDLAENGHRVILVDRDAEALEKAKDTLKNRGFSASSVVADVSDFQSVQNVAGKLLEKFGHIGILVNNAGVSQPKSILEISNSEWDEVIGIHLKGSFNWCKALAQSMVDHQFGRIINISSVNAHTGGGNLAVSKVSYAAAKSGLLGMTRALARELAPYVCVNAICPGSIETDLTTDKINANRKNILSSIPLNRLGSPSDIAKVVSFLATVDPCFITGEVIDVDGGQYIN